jgi:3-oxoacyl-[acyl-carrier protein] reductase
MRFDGQTVLITGGARGIGRAIGEAFAAEGARICVTDLSDPGDLPAGFTFYQADVTDAARAMEICDQIEETFGQLHVLVNNAGIVRDKLLVMMEPADWELVIRINLMGMFNYGKAAATKMMRKRYGRIVNISSIASIRGGRGQTNYAAAKGGANAFTRGLALEMAKRQITVNAVAPGMIETKMSEQVRNLAGDQILAGIPLKRYGQVSDIANAVLFLASDAAAYITGQVLCVDGGMTVGFNF